MVAPTPFFNVGVDLGNLPADVQEIKDTIGTLPAGTTVSDTVQATKTQLGTVNLATLAANASATSDAVIGTATAPGIKDAIFGTATAPGIKDAIFGTPTAPGIKDAIFGTPTAPGIQDAIIGTPTAPGIKDAIIGTPTAPGIKDAIFGTTPGIATEIGSATTEGTIAYNAQATKDAIGTPAAGSIAADIGELRELVLSLWCLDHMCGYLVHGRVETPLGLFCDKLQLRDEARRARVTPLAAHQEAESLHMRHLLPEDMEGLLRSVRTFAENMPSPPPQPGRAGRAS